MARRDLALGGTDGGQSGGSVQCDFWSIVVPGVVIWNRLGHCRRHVSRWLMLPATLRMGRTGVNHRRPCIISMMSHLTAARLDVHCLRGLSKPLARRGPGSLIHRDIMHAAQFSLRVHVTKSFRRERTCDLASIAKIEARFHNPSPEQTCLTRPQDMLMSSFPAAYYHRWCNCCQTFSGQVSG
jgi:hypothetical protein